MQDKALRTFMGSMIDTNERTPAGIFLVPGWWVHLWKPTSLFSRPEHLDHHPFIFEEIGPQLKSLTSLFSRQTLEVFLENRSVDCLRSFTGLCTREEAQNTLAFHRVFVGEHWSVSPDTPHKIIMNLNTYSRELLLGSADLHLDVFRRLNKEETIFRFLGTRASIALSREIWSKLNSVERPLYLRIFSAAKTKSYSQESEGYQHGASLSELFKNLSELSSGTQTPGLVEQLRILASFGRKLTALGVLDGKDFLPNKLDPQSVFLSGCHLSWSFNNNTLASNVESEWVGDHFYRMMESKDYSECMIKLWSYFLKIGSISKKNAEIVWAVIKDIEGAVFKSTSTSVVHLHNLFMEWSIRKNSKSKWSLSSKVLEHPLVALCSLDGDIAGNFARFVRCVKGDPKALESLIETEKCLLGFCEELPNFDSILVESISRSEVIPSRDEPKTTILPKNNEIHEPATKILDTDAKLNRIAQQELEKMIRCDVTSYQNLKETYLKSLEEPQRQLIQDIQRRMRPAIFEEQMKQRLVRFMVSSPGQWTSIRAPLQ